MIINLWYSWPRNPPIQFSGNNTTNIPEPSESEFEGNLLEDFEGGGQIVINDFEGDYTYGEGAPLTTDAGAMWFLTLRQMNWPSITKQTFTQGESLPWNPVDLSGICWPMRMRGDCFQNFWRRMSHEQRIEKAVSDRCSGRASWRLLLYSQQTRACLNRFAF